MSKLPIYLKQLESEAIYILRETAASFERAVLMYSIGKDSSVLLHLAKKAFSPQKIPFPVLHIDTGWKFQEMIRFRDRIAQEMSLDLIVHKNVSATEDNITPFNTASNIYTKLMKTDALKEALEQYAFQAAIGGARRDEEKSRAKERIFSLRNQNVWDPRNQRPEFWNNYNTLMQPDHSFRVFPLSNWTELDVWNYIYFEQIEVVPLYFAKSRPCIYRNNSLIMVDDDRFPVDNPETIVNRKIRFRTLGCYPLTAAIESEATSLSELINEINTSQYSERSGRLIDYDEDSSMEAKKKEGYF